MKKLLLLSALFIFALGFSQNNTINSLRAVYVESVQLYDTGSYSNVDEFGIRKIINTEFWKKGFVIVDDKKLRMLEDDQMWQIIFIRAVYQLEAGLKSRVTVTGVDCNGNTIFKKTENIRINTRKK